MFYIISIYFHCGFLMSGHLWFIACNRLGGALVTCKEQQKWDKDYFLRLIHIRLWSFLLLQASYRDVTRLCACSWKEGLNFDWLLHNIYSANHAWLSLFAGKMVIGSEVIFPTTTIGLYGAASLPLLNEPQKHNSWSKIQPKELFFYIFTLAFKLNLSQTTFGLWTGPRSPP